MGGLRVCVCLGVWVCTSEENLGLLCVKQSMASNYYYYHYLKKEKKKIFFRLFLSFVLFVGRCVQFSAYIYTSSYVCVCECVSVCVCEWVSV